MSEFFSFRRKTQATLIRREERAASIFPVLAYDESDHLFLCDDKTAGFGFICQPLTGADDKVAQQVTALLNESYPADTQMQVLLFRSPDIAAELAAMQRLRRDITDPLFSRVISERAEFLDHNTRTALVAENDKGTYELGYLYDLKLVITFKVPIAGGQPSPKEVSDLRILRTKVKTTLDNIHLQPRTLDAEGWVRVMNTLFNWGEDASWRHSACGWDPAEPLCNQVLDYDNAIEVSRESLRIGSQVVKCLSAKRRPEQLRFGEAIVNAGDLTGRLNGVRHPYLVCTNIIFPEADSEKQKIERKRQYTVNQASGPIVKFVPILHEKRLDFDAIYDSLQAGNRAVRLAYHVVVFGQNLEEAETAAMAVRNYWRTSRFNQPTQPVVGVSWYEAEAYCVWLTAELRGQGVITERDEARLPTPAEWEAAAHSSHGRAYPWGSDTFDPARANTEESGLKRTTPVHMYPDGVTPDGVWDLAGNVWEWTGETHTNGNPWLKGGGWNWEATQARASARVRSRPLGLLLWNWFDYGGFRVVVVPISR